MEGKYQVNYDKSSKSPSYKKMFTHYMEEVKLVKIKKIEVSHLLLFLTLSEHYVLPPNQSVTNNNSFTVMISSWGNSKFDLLKHC